MELSATANVSRGENQNTVLSVLRKWPYKWPPRNKRRLPAMCLCIFCQATVCACACVNDARISMLPEACLETWCAQCGLPTLCFNGQGRVPCCVRPPTSRETLSRHALTRLPARPPARLRVPGIARPPQGPEYRAINNIISHHNGPVILQV